jgi:hypothetical protein
VTRETKKLDVRLPVEMRKALDNLAEQRTAESKATVKAADILREAIAFYLASKDIPISPDVNRGGNRAPPSPAPATPCAVCATAVNLLAVALSFAAVMQFSVDAYSRFACDDNARSSSHRRSLSCDRQAGRI